MIKTIKDIPDLGLIIIDPASRFRGGIENSNEDATKFIIALERIVKRLSVTLLFLHHANKGSSQVSEASQGSSRGASALIDGVRWAVQLSSMTAKQAKNYRLRNEDRDFYINVKITKNNYARPQSAEIWLKRNSHGILSRTILTDMKTANNIEVKMEIANILYAAKSNKEEFTITKFIKTFAGQAGKLKQGEKAIGLLIHEMIDEKTVQFIPPLKSGRNIKAVLALSKQEYHRIEQQKDTAIQNTDMIQ